MPRPRSVIAAHLILTLYGHWEVYDPRGSDSVDFKDQKFTPLGPIHFGRKPNDAQPTKAELKAFHAQHQQLLNFPVFWLDDAKRNEFAAAISAVINDRAYTCYAAAICGNHAHLVIRTHRDKALAMWNHFANAIRQRLRLCFPTEVAPSHPVISARPYNVLLFTPQEVWPASPMSSRIPRKRDCPGKPGPL